MSVPDPSPIASVSDVPGFFEVVYQYDERGRLVSVTGLEERVPSTEPRLFIRYDEEKARPVEIRLETQIAHTGPNPAAGPTTDTLTLALEYDDEGHLRPFELELTRLDQLRWHALMLPPSVQTGREPWASFVRDLIQLTSRSAR